ncbi:MAG: gamma-glutamyltransferase [Nitrososphaeria archaeon]|nr:gamma-glutamyltransferase [Nitrososphaeria archaeon]
MMYKTPFLTCGGVVASEHYLASKIGVEILDRKGNAVDAAVATSLALSVTCQNLCGLGGDFFALYYENNSGKVYCINSSGYAPKNLTIEYLREKGYSKIPDRGPLSITVPGYVYGVYELHKKFGGLEFSDLIEPSIILARKGFPISRRFSEAIRKNYELLAKDAGSSKVFLQSDSSIPQEGEILRFPQLSKTLENVKEHGPKGFYEGEVCEGIVDYVQENSGKLIEEDLKDYKPEWVQPIKVFYKDYEVFEIPPNSMGMITLLILNMIEEIGLEGMPHLSKEYVEKLYNIFRIAYRVKDEVLSDPKFVKIDLEKILSKEYAKDLLRKEKFFEGTKVASGDTTYFAVADKEGNIVSAIQSLYLGFGSGLTVPEYGITLNCRARGFKFDGVNKLEPRKRPAHTLSATILRNKDEVLALGASAGDYRPQIYTQLITNYINYENRIQDALDAPRFVWNGNDEILLENGLYYSMLENKPTLSIRREYGLGVAQAVKVRDNVKWAACDYRGDGIPLGQVY